MHASLETFSALLQNPRFAAGWFDALLKSFVVLAFAAGICLIWRRAAAASRHLIWFIALLSLPLLPLLPHVLPIARQPLWSVSSELIHGNQISLSLELTPAKSASLNSTDTASPQNPGASPEIKYVKRVFSARFRQNWLSIGCAVWAAGMMCMLLYSALGTWQLRKISRKARRLDSADWTQLLAGACDTLRLRRKIILLQSGENVMPLTWGWLRPGVLMPLDAERWPDDRRRIVLLHELAHVKRRDCFTQSIARCIAALYWFNPLAWVAVRRMCIERERACDDLVLNGGCKASDYAGHLVQIAKAFRRAPQMAGVAMARRSNLEQRVTAIVDASRARRLRPAGLVGVFISIAAVIFCIGGYRTGLAKDSDSTLRRQQLAQLKKFSAEKEKQAQLFAAASGEEIVPFFQKYFDAAKKGDVQTVTNMIADLERYHPQYARNPRWAYRTSYWQQMLEIDLAYDHFAHCDPKYTQIAVDGIINSIPPGSIYFGGTDPGRGLPTTFSNSQIDADPFYVLSQNPLADGTYLQYLHWTYGNDRALLEKLAAARKADPELSALDAQLRSAHQKALSLELTKLTDDPNRKAAEEKFNDLLPKVEERANQLLKKLEAGASTDSPAGGPEPIYIPTSDEQQKCFADYTEDAKARQQHDQQFPSEQKRLMPGEDVHVDAQGKASVSGQIAVMGINARIAKLIFDKNPDRDFYVEESFPLAWMFPHLEPNGLIMKINREPLTNGLPDDVLQKDHDFWQEQANEMIGNWLTEDTPVKTVADFAEKVYVRKDLSGFTGDAAFIHDTFAPKMFSKWRSAIGGLYSWRLGINANGQTPLPEYKPKTDAERGRLTSEADFALKQSFALCPWSPEAVFRYVAFLMGGEHPRKSDALLVAQTAAHIDPHNAQLNTLVRTLSK